MSKSVGQVACKHNFLEHLVWEPNCNDQPTILKVAVFVLHILILPFRAIYQAVIYVFNCAKIPNDSTTKPVNQDKLREQAVESASKEIKSNEPPKSTLPQSDPTTKLVNRDKLHKQAVESASKELKSNEPPKSIPPQPVQQPVNPINLESDRSQALAIRKQFKDKDPSKSSKEEIALFEKNGLNLFDPQDGYSSNENDIVDEFCYLKRVPGIEPMWRLTAAQKALCSEALDFPSRNRFGNIFPYNTTRFRIDSNPDFYFNGSWVLGDLATQGPLPNEHAEFWEMVWHSNTSMIVMTTNLKEGSIDKCSQYWPETQKTLEFTNGIKVTGFTEKKAKSYTHDGQGLMKRLFILTRGEARRLCVQYQMLDWFDTKGIHPENSSDLCIRINTEMESECDKNPDAKLLVHCSGGIGRSGTIIAGRHLMKNNEPGSSLVNPLFQIVKKMRTQRNGMVQSYEQYYSLYKLARLHWTNSKI